MIYQAIQLQSLFLMHNYFQNINDIISDDRIIDKWHLTIYRNTKQSRRFQVTSAGFETIFTCEEHMRLEFVSWTRLKWQKGGSFFWIRYVSSILSSYKKSRKSNTLRLNFCFLKSIYFFERSFHPKIVGKILKHKQKNKVHVF